MFPCWTDPKAAWNVVIQVYWMWWSSSNGRFSLFVRLEALTSPTVMTAVFWSVSTCSVFEPECGGSRLLQNIEKYLPDCMASHSEYMNYSNGVSLTRARFLSQKSGVSRFKISQIIGKCHRIVLEQWYRVELLSYWRSGTTPKLVFGTCLVRISTGIPVILTGFSWISSVPPCRCRDSTSTRPRKTSPFQILSNSSVVLTSYNTDSVVK
jgi:hypothetical protein